MSPESSGHQRRGLQLALGLAISGAVIWWTFRNVDWAASWSFIVAADRGWMLLAVILATLPFALRVPRWGLLLRHEDGSPVQWRALWHGITIGFAANNVLPFRAGEVLRVAAVSRLGGVPFPTALSSVAVERILDGLTAIGLMSLSLTLAGIDPTLTLPGGNRPLAELASLIGALGLLALAIAAVAAWQREATMRIALRVLPSNKFGEALYQFGDRVLLGLSALGNFRTALPVLAWSLIIWLVNASAFYVAFSAFGFAIPFTGALVLQGVLLIGIAAPQMPGYFGVFEAAIAGTLVALYQVPFEAGFAYGLMYHVTTFVPITIFGAWSAISTGFRRDAIPEAAT